MHAPLGKQHAVALITGAGSGLGRQLALDLAREGVAIAAIDSVETGLRSLEEAFAKTQAKLAWARADVTDAANLQEQVHGLEERLGPIDLLIASAGVGFETSALYYQPHDIFKVLNVNLIGVSNSIAAVLPGMLRRRRGHVVGISSLASLRGLPRMLGYSASKAGLNALLDGMRVEVAPYGVHVTIVCPGWVRTPMTSNILAPMPHLLEVHEATRHILWAVRHSRAFYAFPWRLAWRMRFMTWLPRSWQDWMIRRLMQNK